MKHVFVCDNANIGFLIEWQSCAYAAQTFHRWTTWGRCTDVQLLFAIDLLMVCVII